MRVKGLDDLSKRLGELAQNAKELGNTKSASLTDILTPEFVSEHTRFADVGEFFDAGGFNVSSQEAFEAVDEATLDQFVRAETTFASWREMLNAAGAAWARRKLGL
jgi:hypothetical protein